MATLRNKRKLAAVSKETPEITRNAQSRNTIDPEVAQEYISQTTIIDKKNSSQSNQYNGITIFNQKTHTDCRVLRSHPGAIQAHQSSRYGNL